MPGGAREELRRGHRLRIPFLRKRRSTTEMGRSLIPRFGFRQTVDIATATGAILQPDWPANPLQTDEAEHSSATCIAGPIFELHRRLPRWTATSEATSKTPGSWRAAACAHGEANRIEPQRRSFLLLEHGHFTPRGLGGGFHEFSDLDALSGIRRLVPPPARLSGIRGVLMCLWRIRQPQIAGSGSRAASASRTRFSGPKTRLFASSRVGGGRRTWR